MNSYQQQQEFEQQERMSSRQSIFDNPLLPSPVISPATVYPSSDRQQQWNTQQQHDDYHSAQPDSQPSNSDPQQSTYAQAYTLEQHYQATPCDNSYYQSHQSSGYPYHSQSGHVHNDHYANPPVVAKVSQFSSLSGALDEPVLQHPRPSYSGSSYSSLIANVDYSRQQSSWSQEAQYQRKPITMPEYVPASSSATSAASSSASGQHQVIAISGTPEPDQESPKVLEGESGESSPNGGKFSKAIQLDENGEKKPFLACGFCRHRKIACGQGPVWENDDQLPPGPRTCNQCFRRCLECFYPTESRRGVREGQPSHKIVYDENDGSVPLVPGEEGAVIEGSPGGDTITVEEEDGTSKKKGNGKAKKKFTCDMVRAVDVDWVLARR
ncbi:hypothetical protein FRC03_012065 [Tulasnella sp. 419]|nr:hypothetical protein FRC02_000236 [Tulasnella sp. 418]KAG8952576.1 hypothetical protein FRC03_012065 [Tulasnella sp. 419]